MPLNSYFSGSTYTTTTEEEGRASKKFWKCLSVWPLMWVNPGPSPLSPLALQRSVVSLLWIENYVHTPLLTEIFQSQPWLSFSSCLHSTSHLVEHSAASGFRVQPEQQISPPRVDFSLSFAWMAAPAPSWSLDFESLFSEQQDKNTGHNITLLLYLVWSKGSLFQQEKKKKQNSLRSLKWCGKHSKTAQISSEWHYHQAAINPARR